MTKIKNLFASIWNYIKSTDIILWLIIIAISTYSLILLRSVSRATYANYARTQLFAILLGFAGAIIISLMDYENLASKWRLIAVIGIILMVYTRLFGENVSSGGGVDATAWITIGGRTFQTSELIKIFFLLTFAKHLDILSNSNSLDSPPQLLLLLGHAAVPVMLCHWQGDDGAGLVFLAIAVFMAFSSGIKIRYFLILLVAILVIFPIIWQFVLAPYQKNRFMSVYNLDDAEIQLNEGYQQYQGMLSIGSGQFSGAGLNNGSRVETNLVTFQHSDFIFSVAGEELGFIGCSLIIILLALLLVKILHVANLSHDGLGKYICFGFFGLVLFQSIANIGMALALLPVMGVTLPFFSAGGSSAMCLYFGIGLVQSVYIRRKESDGFHLTRQSNLKMQYKMIK